MRAKKVVIISDLTGKEVPPEKAVRITITFAEPGRDRVVLDAAEGDVADWVAKGRSVTRRSGRRGRQRDLEGSDDVDGAEVEGVEDVEPI